MTTRRSSKSAWASWRARPNPVWAHLEVAAEVRLAVVGDREAAFIAGHIAG